MAEVAIGILKDKLFPLLESEARLLKDVDKEVTEISIQLEDIHFLLKGADKRAEEQGDNIRGGVRAYDVSKQGLKKSTSKRSRYLPENELVGIESARVELVCVLLDGSSPRKVVPVVGIGGSGKTTLAHQVYDHVKGRFQCYAWVEMPQPYGREEILRILISELFDSTKASVPGEIHTMDMGKLTSKLREFLKGTKYLIIFDDVWKEDFWGDIEHALIDDQCGSRIKITTRKMKVEDFCRSLSSVHIHEMQLLPTDKAWELFCKRTFRTEGYCPKELGKISGEIVERCEGLPLAIVVIAGVLSTKPKTVNEWRKFHASLSSELENTVHLNSIIKILWLSYYELPYYLKSCLLYFGMFPRRRCIRNGRLIRQWIAEGFVKAVEGKTLEEVAQEYMNELISRSLVEESSVDVTEKARICHVHDLIYEIILKKTKEVRFCQILPRRANQSEFRGITRRLSIMINSSNKDLLFVAFSHVHSVTVFREDEIFNFIVPLFATNFKFLKVLDFEDTPNLDRLPEEIGRLFDLRYLSVRGTKVKMLPRSIAKLENLETLDVLNSFVHDLPADMIKSLRKLRNIYALNIEQGDAEVFPPGLQGVKVVGGIGFLKALQKLLYIELDHEGVEDLFEEFSKLTQLRTLGIFRVRSEDWSSLCGCIEKMELLESLNVGSASENEVIDLESISSPPLFLRNINLEGPLNKLPQWFTQIQSTLVNIRLYFSMLKDDAFETLQNMHNLLLLHLNKDSYVGEQLCFKKGMFPKLKQLHFNGLSRLRSLIFEETTLPKLEELVIGACPLMKYFVPTQPISGLQYLRNLKTILFRDMPMEFLMFIDFETVEHVRQVGFSYRDNDGQTKWISVPNIEHINRAVKREIQNKQDVTSTYWHYYNKGIQRRFLTVVVKLP
ncbi:hypothetical protein TIFTF001_037728 [Ficus carica]|uniref:NB-ARC domain-containing protein n=1 Tax=Ficus carica TaxID=3494 RepID=A0AA88E5V2_FICCA|nr:hypothetical protein TIFTF001_037728 [Ficus carica]